MKKLFILYTLLFLLPLLQHNSGALHAQGSSGCYVSYKEHIGVNSSLGLTEVENASCSLRDQLPEEFRSQFKVYSTAYYLHTGITEPSFTPVLQQYVTEISSASAYHIIIAKESANDGVFKRFKVIVTLPSAGPFSCLSQSDREFIATELESVAIAEYNAQGKIPAQYHFVEQKIIKKLGDYIQKAIDCCNNPNKSTCETCELCPSALTADSLKYYFESKLKAVKIPIIIDNCVEFTNTANLSFVEVLKEPTFKFRDGDPYGKIAEVVNEALGSDYFEEMPADNRKGFVTSNIGYCGSDRAQFKAIQETFEQNDPNGPLAKSTANLEYLIWFHVWQNPLETDGSGYLYVVSKTPEWSDMVSANSPETTDALAAAFDVDDYDTDAYSSKFEQAASVLTIVSTTLYEKIKGVSSFSKDPPDIPAALLNLDCSPSTQAQYFLNVAMRPILLPPGIIPDFAHDPHYVGLLYDTRALLAFTDAHGRWNSYYRTTEGLEKIHTGFGNPIHSNKKYKFQTPNKNEYLVWVLDPTRSAYPSRTLMTQKFIKPSDFVITITGGKFPYIYNFTGLSEPAPQDKSEAVLQIDIGVHTISELKKSYAKGGINAKLKAFLFKVPQDTAFPNGPFHYYIYKYNENTGVNEYLQFNCSTGTWDVIQNPFVTDGTFEVLGIAIFNSPWLEELVNTTTVTKHDILDALGMVPIVGELFDMVNGVLYFMDGEKGQAVLALASAIPLIGQGVSSAKKAFKLVPTQYAEINNKFVTGISIFKKVPCGGNKGSFLSQNHCIWVAGFIPHKVRERAKQLGDVDNDEFDLFIQSVTQVAGTDDDYRLVENIADATRLGANGLPIGPDLFHAWNAARKAGATLDLNQLRKLGEDITNTPGLAKAFGDNPELVKAWEGLVNIPNLRTNISWLIRSNKWLAEGAEFVTFSGKTKMVKNTDEILEIRNEKILPIKYDYDPSSGGPLPGGTPIGEAANGYQVYRHGNDLSVRRVPDVNGYNQTELDLLTKNSNSHVLEKHGHDVTDYALIKRATGEGSPEVNKSYSPDGAFGGIPPYSSKFKDQQAVKDAIESIKPGSPAFAAKEQVPPNNNWLVEYPGNFGYGYQSGGAGPIPMTKITAIYEEVTPGNFEIITMYPNK